MPSSISIAGQSNPLQPKRPMRQMSPVSPLFGSVTVSGGDQVRFGANKSQVPVTQAVPVTTATAERTEQQAAAQDVPSAPKYGYIQNNVRAGLGFFFRDIVPVLLSLPAAGGFLGFLLAAACVPLSSISGKIGNRIARDVDHDTLNPLFKYLSSIHDVIKSSAKSKAEGDPNVPTQPVVDRLNQALNDAFNVRNGGWFTKWVVPKLTLSKDGWLGKILEKFSTSYATVLRAEMNIHAAQAKSVGEVGKAAAKGAMDYSFYSIMHWVGTGISKIGFWPFTWIGEMMKQAGWIKIAADVMSSKPNPTPATTPTPAATAT